MKIELIKVDDVYRLVEVTKHGNSIIGTTDLDYQKTWSDRCQKLSLKNCQAIERGYDLDEFVSEYSEGKSSSEVFKKAHESDFKAGFQKALELMGDKKFSEEDLRLAMHFGKFGEANNQTTTIGFIQSLQQTEWDVEIEMGGYRFNDDGQKIGFPSYELPKLDADGCLILKRI